MLHGFCLAHCSKYSTPMKVLFCFLAALCTPLEGDRTWTGSAGKQLTALQIALERGHAATGEAILKAAVKAGAGVSGAALESVEMLHKSASKYGCPGL